VFHIPNPTEIAGFVNFLVRYDTIRRTSSIMSLPFLKPKAQTGLIIQTRKPDGNAEPMESEDSGDHAMEACAEDMLRAISNKDAKALASAIRSALECSSSDGDNDYDSQNIKAAQEEKE
jgi:hypothetical protein